MVAQKVGDDLDGDHGEHHARREVEERSTQPRRGVAEDRNRATRDEQHRRPKREGELLERDHGSPTTAHHECVRPCEVARSMNGSNPNWSFVPVRVTVSERTSPTLP